MKTSLSKIIFKKTIFLVLLLVLSIVGFVYFYTIGLVEKEFLTYVENYQKVKSEKENFVFNNSIKDTKLIATQIKQELSTKHRHHDLEIFTSKYDKLKDGSIRSKKERSEVYPVLFLNKDVVLTKKIEQKILITNQVLENASKELSDFYYNTWVVFHENVNFCISKYKPNANYEIQSSFSDLNEDYWVLTTKEKNKDRDPLWTDLYYDPTFKQWMISYVIPVDVEGVHELSIGVDISLNYLFEEIISGYSLSKSFILSKNGQIIMHPDYLDEIKAGKKYVWDFKSDEMNDSYSLIQESNTSQVLVNLVNNYFDAVSDNKDLTEKGVKVSVEKRENVLKIKVNDSGSGLSDLVSDKMFNPFFTTKPVGKGTGLGLSISKGIIDQHLGKFYYNKESKNTEFVIEFLLEKGV